MSSLFFARELKHLLQGAADEGLAVELCLFPAMFDPARNIYTPHPICEYSSSSFWAAAGAAGGRAAALQKELEERYLAPWLKRGLVEEDPDDGSGAGPKAFRATDGGLFRLMASMEKDLADECRGGRFSVVLHEKFQLTQMWYDEKSRKWSLYSEFASKGGRNADWYASHQVPDASTQFDAVVMGFDLNPRGARKASFKQLLESALPTTCPVIRCLASTPCASVMTCVVELGSQRSSTIEGSTFYGPELKGAAGKQGARVLEVAERLRPSQHSLGRGLRLGHGEVWNLTANVRWSRSVRSSFSGGGWDKKKVERDLVDAFQREVAPGCQVGQYKGLVPCFHWQGAWPLTALEATAAACVFDGSSRLGWASDAFVFLDAAPSASAARRFRTCNILHPFKSASDLAGVVAEDLLGKSQGATRLPLRSEWKMRSQLLDGCRESAGDARELYADTGRADPQDGLDHTWETAAQLAADDKLVIKEADSLRKYRRR